MRQIVGLEYRLSRHEQEQFRKLVPNGYIVKIDGDRFWYATGRPGAGKFLLTRAELLAGEIAAFVGRPSRNIALNAISIPLFEDE